MLHNMKPVKHTLENGEVVELFKIGVLAEALGRASSTVRKWEISGVIPKTIFKSSKNERLYSREQIDLIVSCAEKSGIAQGASLANNSFSAKCHRELKKLNKKYTQEVK